MPLVCFLFYFFQCYFIPFILAFYFKWVLFALFSVSDSLFCSLLAPALLVLSFPLLGASGLAALASGGVRSRPALVTKLVSPHPRPSRPEPPWRRWASLRPAPLRSVDFVGSGSQNRCCGRECREEAGCRRGPRGRALIGLGGVQGQRHRPTVHTWKPQVHTHTGIQGPADHRPRSTQIHQASQPTQGRARTQHTPANTRDQQMSHMYSQITHTLIGRGCMDVYVIIVHVHQQAHK